MKDYWKISNEGYQHRSEPEPLPLFDTEEDNSIQARFERFDAENPQVWERLVELMFEMQDYRNMMHRWSVKAAFEVMRYESLRTNQGDFKLPNDFTSRYARKLLENYPHFEGFIEIRELRTR